MDRREFLIRSAVTAAGTLLGLGGFSRVFACGEYEHALFSSPRIALIIDDIGFSFYRTRQFLDLEMPLTFSVLPRLRNSRDLATEIHERGHEIMLHQPMEPSNPEIDPGPGALYLGFSGDKIATVLEKNFETVPFAVGVNNHMGSRYTECRNDVYEVMKVINGDGLFFVDSLTTSRSTAYAAARHLHVPSACRNRFLDNNPVESAIHVQLRRLIQCAFKYGHAIGIGHPYPETVRALSRFAGEFKKCGVSLVPVSDILMAQDSTQI